MNLATLSGLSVTNVHRPAQKSALRDHYGRRATVLLLPSAPCRACTGYLRKLSRFGRRWHKRGVTLVTVRHPQSPKAKPRRQPKLPWIKTLKWTKGQGPAQSAHTRLLVLDNKGRLTTFFLAQLPAPLVLQHHLEQLTAN